MVIKNVIMEALWISIIKFANTIKSGVSGVGKVNSVSIILNYEFIQYATPYSYVNTSYHRNWTYEVVSLNVNLPALPSSYSSVKGYFFIDGCVDDFWEFYQNDYLIKTIHGVWSGNWGDSGNPNDLIRFQDSSEINISSQNTNLKIKARSDMEPTAAIVYNAFIKVTTRSR